MHHEADGEKKQQKKPVFLSSFHVITVRDTINA